MTVDYAPDELRLEVRDDGHGRLRATSDGLGHGLIGIGERVKTYGGDMSAFVADLGRLRAPRLAARWTEASA